MASAVSYAFCRVIVFTWVRQRDSGGIVPGMGWLTLRMVAICGFFVPLVTLFLFFDGWAKEFRENVYYAWFLIALFIASLLPGAIWAVRQRATLENQKKT